ncbi:hypothetical protein [Riemerella columbina]|uniref:hypothetical protein n=1 Tax=Riemerella columbina TaxID=103810 RepID=UPI00039EB026|nr:hypothetical protein [Riemerella columbina]
MDSIEKGKLFEDYVQNVMFPDERYSIVRKTHNFEEVQQRHIEDCVNPDFTFKRRRTGKEYSVEAKFRKAKDYKVEVCTKEQLERYRKYDENSPTFIALGVGDNPSEPAILLFFHISQLKSTKVFLPTFFQKHYFKVGCPVFSNYLEKLLK